MRKLSFFCFFAVLVGMTSCYHTYYATKKTTFDNVIDSVRLKMADQGFVFVGNRKATNVVSYAKTTIPTPNVGRITSLQKETFRFVDDSGKTMSYSVSYGKGETSKDVVFVHDVELCECETSDPNDFERLCGDESIVNQLSDVPKDQKVKRPNLFFTIMFTSFLTVIYTGVLAYYLFDSFH